MTAKTVGCDCGHPCCPSNEGHDFQGGVCSVCSLHEQGGILLPEEANAFVRKLIQGPTMFGPHGAVPPVPRYKRPWRALQRRWRDTRTYLAWEVLRGRNPIELHEDCW